VDGDIVKVKLYDTAGEETTLPTQTTFSIEKSLYKQSNGIILIFDITKRESFDKLEAWIKDIEDKVEEHTIKTLIGNKIDLEGRTATIDEMNEFAKKHSFDYYETSAKENKDVNTIFSDIIKKTYLKVKSLKPRESFQLMNKSQIKTAGCCT